MPIVNVTVSGRPDAAQARRIAETVSDLTRRHLRKDPTITSVAVHFIEPEFWFVGGRSLAERRAESFWLDIKVVDGSNLKTEIAEYLRATFEALSASLGPTDPESYALVHEVPAAAYGYGGKSQEFRFVAARIEAESTKA